MQTFLPFPDFKKSLECLDNKRLNKQKVENFQILNILLNRTDSKAWRNHPAVKMWAGYENALKEYQNFTIDECLKRGFKNTLNYETISGNIVYPKWLGNEEFHRSHRSNLLRKDKNYYSKYFNEPDNLKYVWPI